MKVVLSTAPAQAAQLLASSLIEERVAACVNILPDVRSVYRWEGRVESSDEVLLVIKTSDESLAELMTRLAALHPYDVPEIVALDTVGVHAPYARWVDASTGTENGD